MRPMGGGATFSKAGHYRVVVGQRPPEHRLRRTGANGHVLHRPLVYLDGYHYPGEDGLEGVEEGGSVLISVGSKE